MFSCYQSCLHLKTGLKLIWRDILIKEACFASSLEDCEDLIQYSFDFDLTKKKKKKKRQVLDISSNSNPSVPTTTPNVDNKQTTVLNACNFAETISL